MKSHFNSIGRMLHMFQVMQLHNAVAIDALKREAKQLDDGSVVVIVSCSECGERHEQMLGHAITCVRQGLDLICIKCDPAAS
jgi:hypothetical protein